MMPIVFRRFWSTFLFGLLWTSQFSFAGIVGNSGFYGYSTVPSSRQIPEGDLGLFLSKNGQSDLAVTPFTHLEMGASLGKNSRFAMKLQIPRMDTWQPILAVGAFDVVGENRRWENLYFVGGYELSSSEMLFTLELGGIYHQTETKPHTTSFLAGELDFGMLSLMGEALRNVDAITLIPSIWFRPFAKAPGDPSSILVVGGGLQTYIDASLHKPTLWGRVGIQVPLHRFVDTIEVKEPVVEKQISNEPRIWLEINPGTDHYFETEATENGPQYRAMLDLQMAIRFHWAGLFWMNGGMLSPMESKNTYSLPERAIWDRSYLLYSSQKKWGSAFQIRAPSIGVGMLQKESYGALLWQDFNLRHWHSSRLTGLVLWEGADEKSIAWKQPIHPIGPSVLRWTQLYAEAKWSGKSMESAWGTLRIGSDAQYLDASVGYLFASDMIWAKAEMRFDFSFGWRARSHDVQFTAFNRIHQTWVSPLYKENVTITPTFISNKETILWEPYDWTGPKTRKVRTPFCDYEKGEWAKLMKNKVCAQQDNDQDGIANEWDKCPFSAEDKDGFQDSDGCPDLDNDGDRIPDDQDRCPNLAEDRDGIEDSDGCPDPDNDGDGIPDSLDACPDQREDFDQFEDHDGCPDIDNDKDGIRDIEDVCPNEPGKGYPGEARRGCPELDDQDGIPYELDACPSEPEDYDGFEDHDGCPDPDNDGDGIPDSLDKCPNEPEIMDGISDTDGCP
jgi:hypothetical protein